LTKRKGEEGETILDDGNEDDGQIPGMGCSNVDQQTEDEASSEEKVSILKGKLNQ
jgi:hypothetical protein